MNKLQETEQQHLQEQATLAVKLTALNDETAKVEKRLNEVNVVLNTFKFIQSAIKEDSADTTKQAE